MLIWLVVDGVLNSLRPVVQVQNLCIEGFNLQSQPPKQILLAAVHLFSELIVFSKFDPYTVPTIQFSYFTSTYQVSAAHVLLTCCFWLMVLSNTHFWFSSKTVVLSPNHQSLYNWTILPVLLLLYTTVTPANYKARQSMNSASALLFTFHLNKVVT